MASTWVGYASLALADHVGGLSLQPLSSACCRAKLGASERDRTSPLSGLIIPDGAAEIERAVGKLELHDEVERPRTHEAVAAADRLDAGGHWLPRQQQ
jgi:hypothetical protein